jgi:ferrous iron transport protein A
MLFLKKNTAIELCLKNQRQEKPVSQCSFPLTLATQGEKVKIVHIRGGAAMQERLLGMGLALESEIVVIQKQVGGAMLIAKNGHRLLLGGGMAQKINVSRW